MKKAITTRALVTLNLSGTLFRGTYHKPAGLASQSDMHASASGRTGVLIVNSLTAPRAGSGDSAVYWAEVLAQDGYPCFRFDLPGLGDSEPEIQSNTDLLTFITNGGYSSMIGHLLEELVARFDLDGVVVMGHCAGAISALYAGSKQKLCRGLILMDPYFNNPRIINRVMPAISGWSRHNRLARLLRQSYDFARDLRRTLLRDGLPASANRALLQQWRHVASRGMPILIVQSPGLKPGPGQFDYIRFAIESSGRKGQITVQLIPDTDHSFSNYGGRHGVHKHARIWLAAQNLLKHDSPVEDEVLVLARESGHTCQAEHT